MFDPFLIRRVMLAVGCGLAIQDQEVAALPVAVVVGMVAW